MTTWTPRPPSPYEPACWSWPLPPARSRQDELSRLIAEDVARAASDPDPDARRDPQAFRMLLADMAVYWFDFFHAGRCAVCENTYRLVKDHSHTAGMWRGWLCSSCNVREARAADAPVMDLYRAWHPAAILDLYEPFTGTGWTRGWSWREHGAAAESNPPRPPTPWPAFAAPLVLNPSFEDIDWWRGIALAETEG